jgi:hypothetical protein
MAKSALVALGSLPNGTNPHIYDARCGRAGGLRVASTLRPPHLLHRNRFTNVAIGGSGMMARRDSAAPVNTPTCRQLRHSTVTVGSARDARSDIPEKIGRLLPLSESTHNGQRQDSTTRRASKAANEDAPLLSQRGPPYARVARMAPEMKATDPPR